MLDPIPLLLAGLALLVMVFVAAWRSATVGWHPHRTPTPAP